MNGNKIYNTQSFYYISGVSISGSCVGTYGQDNYIVSPKYPQKYENNIDCRWLISSHGVKNLTLKILDFITEESSDILEVYDGQSTNGILLHTLSGNSTSTIMFSGNNMYLKFTSDFHTTYRGFEIEISGKYKHYHKMISIFIFTKYKRDILIHTLYI